MKGKMTVFTNIENVLERIEQLFAVIVYKEPFYTININGVKLYDIPRIDWDTKSIILKNYINDLSANIYFEDIDKILIVVERDEEEDDCWGFVKY